MSSHRIRVRTLPKRLRGASATAIGAFLLVCALAGPAVAAEHIVFVTDDANASRIAASAGARVDQEFSAVADGFTADLTPAQVRRIETDPQVLEVRADRPFALMPFKRAPFKRAPFKRAPFKRADASSPWRTQIVPTGVQRIGAWAPGLSTRPVDADIAVLDGGVDDSHPDLNVAGSVSCVRGVRPRDEDGHGTMVAGLAAARDNGFGIVGAAPGARIWSVKVADADGTIMESSALCGLEWVLQRSRTIEVANMSWAGEGTFSGESCDTVVPASDRRIGNWRRLPGNARHRFPWRRGHAPRPGQGGGGSGDGNAVDPASIDALEALACQLDTAGVTLVAAAGNDAQDANGYLPAAWPQVIAVSSLADTDGRPGGRGPAGCMTGDRDDYLSSFTNFGSVIAIAAPGECLVSTDAGNEYAVGSGTSFAAPLVSGAAARLAARSPDLKPGDIRTALLAAAEPGPIPGDTDGSWEGVLRVGGA